MALNSGLAKEADIDDLHTLKKKLTDIINTLTEREREILKQRFGLKGNARTLGEVSSRFQVIRERIRQIEVKALRKMRQPTRIRKLEELVNFPNLPSSDGGDKCAEDKKNTANTDPSAGQNPGGGETNAPESAEKGGGEVIGLAELIRRNLGEEDKSQNA